MNEKVCVCPDDVKKNVWDGEDCLVFLNYGCCCRCRHYARFSADEDIKIFINCNCCKRHKENAKRIIHMHLKEVYYKNRDKVII